MGERVLRGCTAAYGLPPVVICPCCCLTQRRTSLFRVLFHAALNPEPMLCCAVLWPGELEEEEFVAALGCAGFGAEEGRRIFHKVRLRACLVVGLAWRYSGVQQGLQTLGGKGEEGEWGGEGREGLHTTW